MALGVVLVGLALGELLARELLAREPQLLARGLIGGAGLDPVTLGIVVVDILRGEGLLRELLARGLLARQLLAPRPFGRPPHLLALRPPGGAGLGPPPPRGPRRVRPARL